MDGKVDYTAALEDVQLPMLFLSGRADRIVTPDRVRVYFDALGTDDKAFEVASIANGYHANYGHLDYGLGDSAKTEIYPLIIEWFERYP
jgi:alpha-beta hydrolase superfamily lysophospholipase